MTATVPRPGGAAAFADALRERAEDVRVPALFERRHADAAYQLRDRGGVSAVMLPTSALSELELEGLLRFRLAEYLAAGFADPRAVFESGLEHEPLEAVPPGDLHVIAGSAHDGRLLCCLSVRSAPLSAAGRRMRSHSRRPFPVEEMHGIGIYDRLEHLPDLPVAAVREVGRFVKAQRVDELGIRAPLEVLIALIRGTLEALWPEVQALIGEVEKGVVKRNLDFFEIPTVLIRGTVSYEAPSWYVGHSGRAFFPFALSVPDVGTRSLPRVAAVERALALPGRDAVPELLALKRTATPPPSLLEPLGGLPPLAATEVAHAALPMRARRRLREHGERLRAAEPFAHLTSAEATVLRTLMTECRRRAGDVIVREGQPGDRLIVIEDGEAELVDGRRGRTRLPRGSCFGGSVAPATVIARTPVTLLELSADDYARYVSASDDRRTHV